MEVSAANADPGDLLDYTVTTTNASVFVAPEVTLTVDYPENLVSVVEAIGAVDNGKSITTSRPVSG